MSTRASILAVVVVVGTLAVGAVPATAQQGTVDCSFPVEATDSTETAVTVSEEPERVTVLGPSTAQTMWEIDAEAKVVGMPVNRFTAYLDGSESRTHVVDELGQPVIETVVSTEPDLVLAPNIIGPDAVESLRDAGLTVYRFEAATSLSDVSNKTRLTGRLVGAFDTAAQVSARTEAVVSTVDSAVSDAERPMVYYPQGGGYTAGPGTFIGDVISTAGADNVATRANISTYGQISQEVLAANTIDWIVASEGLPLPKNPAVNNSRAVAEDQIKRVNANLISQPAPRVVEPLVDLARTLHPDAMADVTLSEIEGDASVGCASSATTPTGDSGGTTTVMADGGSTTVAADGVTTTAAETDGSTTTNDDGATTASGDAPGFTVALALVALLAVSALAARRR